MSVAAFALVAVLLALWVLLSYVTYCVAMRIAPSFFQSHHPETAIAICVLLGAVLYAVWGWGR